MFAFYNLFKPWFSLNYVIYYEWLCFLIHYEWLQVNKNIVYLNIILSMKSIDELSVSFLLNLMRKTPMKVCWLYINWFDLKLNSYWDTCFVFFFGYYFEQHIFYSNDPDFIIDRDSSVLFLFIFWKQVLLF